MTANHSNRLSVFSGLFAGFMTLVAGLSGGLVWAVAVGVGVLVFAISFWGGEIEENIRSS